MFDEYFQLD